MERRIQPRVPGILPIRISGTDRDGLPFSELVCTTNISASGAGLAGVRTRLCLGDTLRIGYRNRTACFHIRWIVVASSAPPEIHVGLESLDPEKEFWPIRLPVESAHLRERVEAYGNGRRNLGRRGHARFSVSGKAFVSRVGAALGTWLKIGDIGISGCYLQTSEPLKVGQRATLLIEVADNRIEASGIVRFSDSNSGMGIGYTYMSTANQRKLTHLIAQLERAGALVVEEVWG